MSGLSSGAGPGSGADFEGGSAPPQAPSPGRFAWLILLWFAASFCYQRLPSADLWWLLADGRLIWENGAIPRVDPFSWTAAGAAWQNDQWLSAFLSYGAYQLGGLSLLHGLKAALLLATLAIGLDTGRRLQTQLSWPGLMLALALALLGSEGRFFFDVRAYLFTYLCLSLLWRWLQLDSKPALWKIGLLFALWANLHGGVSSGFLLIGLECVTTRQLHAVKMLVVALLAACLNPSGPWLLWHPFELLTSPWGRYLNEWQPIWRRPDLFLYHGAHFLLWTLACVRQRRRQDVVLWLFGLFSLTGWRHIPLFAFLSLPRWCAKLQWQWPRAQWLLGLALVGWAGLKPLKLTDPGQSLENSYFPRWAAEFLAQNGLRQPMFHPYGLGGYLLWKLRGQPPVCIDGRAVQVYPWPVYRDYLRAAFDREAFARYVQEHDIRLVMLFAGVDSKEAGTQLLSGSPEWKELHRDGLVVLYGRGLAGEFRPVTSPYSLWDQAVKSKPVSRPLLEQSLGLQSDFLPARMSLAILDLQAGQTAPMLKLAQELPLWPEPHFYLAMFYRQSDPARAQIHAARVRQLAPNSDLDRRL